MTKRRKIGTWLAAVALVGLAALFGARRLQSSPATATNAASVRSHLPRASLPKVASGGLTWFFEPGLPARRLAGIVRQGETPVAGAHVEARPWQLRDDVDTPASASAVTDAQGRFSLGDLPAGAWVVAASKEGFVPGGTRVDSHDPGAAPGPDALVIELGACTRKLRGRVADVQGRPIAAAELRVQARHYGAGLLAASTAADGSFEICVGDGGLGLSAWAPGFERVTTLHAEPPAHDLELRLFAAAAIEGVVVDREGHPVEGALVEASAPMISSDHHTAVSGPGGAFRLEHVSPGRNDLEAEHPGHGRSTGTRVQVAAGTTLPGVLVELSEPCRQLAGVVRTQGRPLAGVAIFGSFTQADGSFVAACQPTDAIEPQVKDYLVESPATIPAGEASIDDLVITLGRGAVVHGVVSAAGRPVAGARVFPSGSDMMARSMRRGDVGAGTAVSDAAGRYRIGGLPAGVIELRAENDAGDRSPLQALELSAAADVALDLALVAGGSVSGVVRDASGRPVPQVVVQASGGDADDPRSFSAGDTRATSRADGRYQLAGLEAARYTLSVARLTPAGGTWPAVDVAAGAHVALDLQVAEPGGRAIAGTVRYADGTPAAGARLRSDGPPLAFVHEDGRFRIEEVSRDRYDLQIISGDGTLTEVKDVHAGDENVAITLARPGSIDGRIAGVGDDDTWSVHVRQSGGGRGAWSSDVRGGHFVTSALAPGSYRVVVIGAHGKGEGRVDVLEGEVAEVTVTIAASGSVTGVARVFPDGAPAPGLDCHALAATHATTGADGSFALADVPPGHQRVNCESPEGATQRRGGASFALAESGSARVEVWVVDVDTQRIQSERQVADLGADLVPSAGATVALENVTSGGPAARAGLAAGDVVVLVDGVDATGTRSGAVDAYVDARVPGSKVAFVVRRGASQVTATVTLGAKDY